MFANPTMAQMKSTKKSKAKVVLFAIVSPTIFLQGLCSLKQIRKYGITLNKKELRACKFSI